MLMTLDNSQNILLELRKLNKTNQELLLTYTNQLEFSNWLSMNHTVCDVLNIRIFKAKSGIPSINYQEALEVALCYGWIDGIKKSFDENSWVQRFTPRRPKSLWSARNVKIVQELIAQNRMTEFGLIEIEKAKQDGRWENAYSAQSDSEIPEDLLAIIRNDETLFSNFAKLKKGDLYSIYFKLKNSKRAETREKWLKHIIWKLALDEKIF